MTPEARLLCEAKCAATNCDIASMRQVTAREAASIELRAIANADEARGHLLNAIRSGVIALALLPVEARAPMAKALSSMVDAARARPARRASTAMWVDASAPYWIEP